MDIPSGYVFRPTEKELIVHFLMRKILSQDLPFDIPEVDLYQYGHPKDLAETFRPLMDYGNQKCWYFFTKLEHGCWRRPNRAAGLNEGFWRPTASRAVITVDHKTLGHKRTFCYLVRQHRCLRKTFWIMHEYSIPKNRNSTVLCRICQRSGRSCKRVAQGSDGPNNSASQQFITDASYNSSSTPSQDPINLPHIRDSRVDSAATDEMLGTTRLDRNAQENLLDHDMNDTPEASTSPSYNEDFQDFLQSYGRMRI